MRIGKRIATVTTLGAVGAALLIPASASAATYTYCGTANNSSGTCGRHNGWGAVWDKPKYDRTLFTLCVNPPSGNTVCNRYNSSRRGYKAVNLYLQDYRASGRYGISWRHHPGGLVDRDSFYLARGE